MNDWWCAVNNATALGPIIHKPLPSLGWGFCIIFLLTAITTKIVIWLRLSPELQILLWIHMTVFQHSDTRACLHRIITSSDDWKIVYKPCPRPELEFFRIGNYRFQLGRDLRLAFCGLTNGDDDHYADAHGAHDEDHCGDVHDADVLPLWPLEDW